MGKMRFDHYTTSPCLCMPNPDYNSRMMKVGCGCWHVDGVAAVQGVRFSQVQANLVAFVLNVARLVGIEERW